MIHPFSAIEIGTRRVRIDNDPAGRETLKAEFAARHVLRLRGFLGADLLATVHRRLRDAPFETRVARRVDPPAVDWKLRDDTLHGLLQFVLNDAPVLEFVRDVADAPELTGFVGAVYRLKPRQGHSDSWHDDVDGNRLIGLSVNLSEGQFEGGELEMRERDRGHHLWSIANTGPGDALLFDIAPALEHHITPMAGHQPKTALAGWFCRDADLKS